MVDLSREELNRIAKLSGLKIADDEAEQLRKDLEMFLSYAQQLFDVKIDHELEANRNVNVFREDKVYKQHEISMKDVFEHEHNNFLVVPKVLE